MSAVSGPAGVPSPRARAWGPSLGAEGAALVAVPPTERGAAAGAAGHAVPGTRTGALGRLGVLR